MGARVRAAASAHTHAASRPGRVRRDITDFGITDLRRRVSNAGLTAFVAGLYTSAYEDRHLCALYMVLPTFSARKSPWPRGVPSVASARWSARERRSGSGDAPQRSRQSGSLPVSSVTGAWATAVRSAHSSAGRCRDSTAACSTWKINQSTTDFQGKYLAVLEAEVRLVSRRCRCGASRRLRLRPVRRPCRRRSRDGR